MEINQCHEQDEKIRNQFIQDYGKHFKKIIPTNPDAVVDIWATGQTGEVYRIELKERYYSADFFKEYPAFMMEKKFYFFQHCFKYQPDIKGIFFMYCNDATISYNITNRLRTNSEQLILVKKMVQDNVYEKGTPKLRYVCLLQFSPELYGDKIVYYTKNEMMLRNKKMKDLLKECIGQMKLKS